MTTTSALCGALLAAYLASRVYNIWNAQLNNDRRIPRLITPFQILSMIGAILPKSPFFRRFAFPWDERDSLYKNANLKTVVAIPLFYGRDVLYTSSLAVFHQAVGLHGPAQKSDMSILKILGENVVTAEGDTWKRHRRITAPAFNHSTYRNVWETTEKVYADMLQNEGWVNMNQTPVADFNKITHKLALFIVSIVGFNIPMSWSEPPRDEKGQLSVQAMIFEVASSIMPRSQIPKWCYYLGIDKLKAIDEAYCKFEVFMHERIAEREAHLSKIRATEGTKEADVSESIKDIFGRLVNARISEGKLSLSDEEIIGNCFIFAFAGHETTANTLSMALSLLALYPDKQEWVYNTIKSAIGDRSPTFEDYDNLTGVLACFYEALRLYPAAYTMIRITAQDCIFSIPRRDDPDTIERISVKKGTPLYLDIVGMLYDPQTFPDPESFIPDRWTDSLSPGESNSPSITKDTAANEVSASSPASSLEGFVGFSFGPRTCLGHKFAKVEAVAFLTLLLREWRVEVVLRDGETKEEWKARVLNPSLRVSMTVKEVPLKLVRRK
ncbi:hypothetical protein ACEPAI_7651 [Sanghuangporus weigelae]